MNLAKRTIVARAGAIVSRKMVHHDDVAGRQCRHENLLDIGQEGCAVEHHGGCHAGEPEAGREGGGLPVSMRDGRPAALARRDRPRCLAILVEAPVSSMKISFSGSTSS